MTRHLGRASHSGLRSHAVTVPRRWPGAESRAHGALTAGVPPMTQPCSRVALYAAIRRDARSGMSNRALQRKHGVGFRTVTAALESAWPKERKHPPIRGSRRDAYRVVSDDWRRSDRDAPRKQRLTAKRIFDRLLDEHDGAGGVSCWLVRGYVA